MKREGGEERVEVAYPTTNIACPVRHLTKLTSRRVTIPLDDTPYGRGGGW